MPVVAVAVAVEAVAATVAEAAGSEPVAAVEADDDGDPAVPAKEKTSAVEDFPLFVDSPSRCYDWTGAETEVAKDLGTAASYLAVTVAQT